MSKSSSSRSVWSLVLKIVITVATAIGGVFEYKVACNPMRTITLIIIHCSATPEGKSLSAEACRQDHILHRGFRDIGYHFYITRDGEIHRGRALEKIGAHCRNHNAHSIGVCYEGGLDANGKPKDTRTLEQKGALLALLRELKRQFPKALVVGHRDLNPMKGCPCFDAVKEYSQIISYQK